MAVSVWWLWLKRQPVLANIPVRVLLLPVYVSGTLQWINPAAVGHRLGLGYSLGCTLTVPPSPFFATLNDYAPAWSCLIPGVPSEGAKEFSLYISGWCLQKSSDGIWQGACQHCASQNFTQHGRGSYTLSIRLVFWQWQSLKKNNHTYTHTHTPTSGYCTFTGDDTFLVRAACQTGSAGAETYFL